jgi:hypothetical protein
VSNTNLETDSVLIQVLETRTLHGEQNATNVGPQSPRTSSCYSSSLQVVIMAEEAVVAEGEVEGGLIDHNGPGGMFRGGRSGDRDDCPY